MIGVVLEESEQGVLDYKNSKSRCDQCDLNHRMARALAASVAVCYRGYLEFNR